MLEINLSWASIMRSVPISSASLPYHHTLKRVGTQIQMSQLVTLF